MQYIDKLFVCLFTFNGLAFIGRVPDGLVGGDAFHGVWGVRHGNWVGEKRKEVHGNNGVDNSGIGERKICRMQYTRIPTLTQYRSQDCVLKEIQ